MDALEKTLTANDALQSHLSNEYDNGRLLRLLLKLGTLNERPDRGGGEWAETGERYILKLFRDYCFHQVCQVDGPKRCACATLRSLQEWRFSSVLLYLSVQENCDRNFGVLPRFQFLCRAPCVVALISLFLRRPIRPMAHQTLRGILLTGEYRR